MYIQTDEASYPEPETNMLDTKTVAEVLNTTEKKVKWAAAVIRENDTAFGIKSGNAWKYNSNQIDAIKAMLAK